MESEKNIVHTLKLTTVTPVAVGANDTSGLSPYTDFFVDEEEGVICLLDQNRLEKAMEKKPHLVNEFVNGIYDKMDNNQSRFSIRAFIEKNFADIDLFISHTLPNKGLLSKDRKQLKEVIKTGGRPYLPGSSLKGAIRTAMLYEWLVFTEDGRKTVAKYANLLLTVTDIEQLEREVFDETLLFQKLDDATGHLSRHIRVSDTSVWKKGLYADNAKRIRLRPSKNKREDPKYRDSAIPQPREAVFSMQPVTFSLTINPRFESDKIEYLRADIGEILDVLNAFTIDSLKNELHQLNSDNANHPQFNHIIDGLEVFYKALLTRAEDDGEIFLRIGSGKTIYDNSLALALINSKLGELGERALQKLKEHFWDKKAKFSKSPVTRVVSHEGKPFGWIKIEKS